MAQTKETYVINKEVVATAKNGSEVLVGHIRSRDGRIFYFNPLKGVGQKWLDSLNDQSNEAEEDEIEF